MVTVVAVNAVAASFLVGAPARADTTFTAPNYPSAACTPIVGSSLDLGVAPQQWNSVVGLPLTPAGTPAAQKIVIGEFDQTANVNAVNLLLTQCGLDPITMTSHTNAWYTAGANVVGGEATLDVSVAAAALPDNASITLVNVASNQGWYGLFVEMAKACGMDFDGDPTTGARTLSRGSSYPAGGCIMSLSYGGSETLQGDTSAADWMLDQLAANGVVVAVSAGDEGSGGCISAGTSTSPSTNFGDATLVGVSGFSAASNVATLTTDAAHGFTGGQNVFLGTLAPHLDGMYEIQTVPTTTTFTVNMTTPDQGATVVDAVASVNFGGLMPQYPASNPNVLAVGGTQWAPQADTRTYGLGIDYVAGTTMDHYTWWDTNPNPNCANLSTFPTTGGEATGGGQSGKYVMPAYQQAKAASSYPGSAARRMMPDVAALAGWPTFALANPGIRIRGAELTSNVATLYTGVAHFVSVGDEIDVALLTGAFSGLNVTGATVTAVTDVTLSYALTGTDIAPAYVSAGNVSQSCTAPCSNTQFPWFQVVGTSAATPLTAIGIANVNASLSARGLSRITNDGGSMDIHSLVYSTDNSTAFRDVTSGSNDIHSLGGYSALTGYDMVTGMGVPNFSTLASLLIARLTPSGGGGSSTPVVTSPVEEGDPVVNPPAVISTDPVQEVVLTPTVVNLGKGVLAATGPNTATTKRLLVKKKATRKVSSAPRVNMPLRKWRVPVVRVGGAARDFTAQIRVGKTWRTLAGVTSNARGRVALPAIRVTRAKNYRVRLIDDRGRRYFVVLRVQP